MSQNLIGYMVVGPETLSDAAIAAGKVHQRARRAAAVALLEFEEEAVVDAATCHTPWNAIAGGLRDGLVATGFCMRARCEPDRSNGVLVWRENGPVGFGDWSPGDLMDALEVLACASDADLDGVVDPVRDLWVDGANDAASRLIGEGNGAQHVLFAGDSTWGDTPDGLGYQTLREAAEAGVLDAMGIR